MITETVLALLLQAPGNLSQDAAITKEVEAVCRQVLCRPASTVRLKRKDGTMFDMAASDPMPIVTGGVVTVMAGETVYVEARVEGKRLVGLTAVSKVANPPRTLTLRLHQEPSVGDGTGMILRLESPFPGALKYRLGMMLLDDDRLRRTSTCPVKGGTANFEHWPHPIFQLVATDFRLEEPSSKAATTCE